MARSFRGGAERLSITQSAISRHVANIESIIGQKLFDRTPRGVSLSGAGVQLLEAVRKGFDDIEDTLNRLDANRSLRIHMPPAFMGPMTMDMVRDFRLAQPQVSIDVVSSNDTGAAGEGADIAILFERARVDDQVSDLLKPILFIPLCAPQAAPHPGEPMEAYLARSELLHVRISNAPDGHLWQAYAEQKGIRLKSKAGVTFATAAAAADYAAGGGGVMLGDLLAEPSGTGGRPLIQPFPSQEADLGYGYYLRMRPETLADPAAARFRKWIIDRFAGPAAKRAIPVSL